MGTYNLTSDSGSFALNGTAANLLQGYQVGAAAGSFALTGIAANLLRGYYVGAAAGAFLLTGQDAGVLRNLVVSAESGAFVLNGQDAALTFGFVITEQLSADDFLLAQVSKTVTESLAVTAIQESWWSITSTESLVVDATATTKGAFVLNIVAKLHVKETHGLAFLLNVAESAVFTGNSIADRRTAIGLVEAVIMASPVSTQHNALVAIAEAIVQSNDLSCGFATDFTEALGITGASTTDIAAVLNVLESLVETDASSNIVRMFMSPTENLALADSLTSKQIFAIAITEGWLIGGVVTTPEGSYDAWVLNVETRSPYKYDNYPFNSYAEIGGKYYAVTASGLYELTGDSDDGEDIRAMFKTGMLNMGTTLFKRVPRAYLGYTTDGRVLFKTITTESGKKIERWYEMKEKTADDTTQARIKMARGVKSVYWQFEIVNVEGADFDFDEISLLPVLLKRRR